MPAKRKPQPLLDQEFGHWHVLGPILWTVFAYCVGGGLLDQLDVSPLYVAGVGTAVSLLAPLTAIYKRFAFLLMATTTGLLTWTTATTPWARDPALTAAAVGVLFGVGYQALRKREAKEADADKLAEKAASKGRYVELLETIGVKGLKEAGRTPFAAGKTIRLLLPVNGSVTLRRLQEATEQLEIAAARAGLDVTFDFETDPASRASVLLHVFDRDILAEMMPLEFDRGPKSIHDPIPLGRYATGELTVVTFREVAALMVGLKGKGKSALINTHLAHLTGCTDAVVWMLDGKGGETVRPWIQPFLEMVTERPAIDWVAWEPEEFDAVLLAARAVSNYRTRARLTPLSPTPSRPAVVVIVEEASMITGVARRGGGNRVQLAQDGVTQGRSSAVDWLFASQRATVTMIGNGDMKSNLDLRYGLGVTDPQDARSIFPDGRMASRLYRLGSDPIYRGTFLMQSPGSSRVMPSKGFYVDPDTIPGIAVTNSQWVAGLDRETADAVHAELERLGVPGGYYGRWDRVRRAMGYETTGDTVPSQRPVPASQPRETTGETVRETPVGPAQQAVRDALERGKARRDDETFRALMESAGFTEGSEAAETAERAILPDTVPAILRLTLAVFQAHGNPETLPSRVICDNLPGTVSVQLLGRLMALCNVSSQENLVWDGKRARGYARDDVETSVKRGSWTQGAFDWQP